jgi:hypothetical protein
MCHPFCSYFDHHEIFCEEHNFRSFTVCSFLQFFYYRWLLLYMGIALLQITMYIEMCNMVMDFPSDAP